MAALLDRLHELHELERSVIKPSMISRYRSYGVMHDSFCMVQLMLFTIAILADHSFWPICVTGGPYHLALYFLRRFAERVPDPAGSLLYFSRGWLVCTIVACTTWIAINNSIDFLVDLPSFHVLGLASSGSMISLYMRLSGIPTPHRWASLICICLAHWWIPCWSQMPQRIAVALVAFGQVAGEVLGFVWVHFLFSINDDDVILKSSSNSEPLSNPRLAAEDMKAVAAEPLDAAPSTPRRLRQLLLDIDLSVVVIRSKGLTFSDPVVNEVYVCDMIASSETKHYALSTVGIVLGAFSVVTSPSSHLLGLTILCFYIGLMAARACITASQGREARAALIMGRAWLVCTLAASCAFCADILFGSSCDIKDTELRTLAVWALLLAMMPIHLRSTAVPRHYTVVTKASFLLVLLIGRQIGADGSAVDAEASKMLWLGTLFACFAAVIGELIAYSLELSRMQSWYHDQLQVKERVKAEAEAQRQREIDEAQQVAEERKAIDAANRAADSRLNHVIKGQCGAAVSVLQGFQEKSMPEVLKVLQPRMQIQVRKMIDAVVNRLGHVIQWCHRRQMLLEQELGTYKSTKQKTDVAHIINSTPELMGRWSIPESDRVLMLDSSVLQLILDEAMSNARKYAEEGSVRASGELDESAGVFKLDLTSTDMLGTEVLTEEECKRAVSSGYKTNKTTAHSDGLGVLSMAKAAVAAGGQITLSTKSEGGRNMTTVHLVLPAARPALEPEPEARHPSPARARGNLDGQEIDVGEKKMRCVGMHDSLAGRLLHTVLFDRYLSGDMLQSVSLGVTAAEQRQLLAAAVGSEQEGVEGSSAADVVLLGWHTSEGADACLLCAEQLRVLHYGGIICVLAEVTPPPAEELRLNALADLVLTQPSTPDDVVSAITQAVRSSHNRQPRPSLLTSLKLNPSPSPSPCINPRYNPSASPSYTPDLNPNFMAIGNGFVDASFSCVAIDDDQFLRELLVALQEEYLGCDMESSCVLGESVEEQLAFTDVALGFLDRKLQCQNPPRPAHVAIVDQNINLEHKPPILGSELIKDMRARGFTGVTCVLTGESIERVEHLRTTSMADLVFEKGHSLSKISEDILSVLSQRLAENGMCAPLSTDSQLQAY